MASKKENSRVVIRLNSLEREIRELKAEIVKITEITKSDSDLVKMYYSQEQYNGMLTSHEFRKVTIMNFLKEKDMAFKPVEIARTLNMPQQKANRALRTLVQEGRIVHKSPYYILNKKEKIR